MGENGKITEITSKVGNGATTPYYAMINSAAVVIKSIKMMRVSMLCLMKQRVII